jgi:hypothetical protein
MIVPTNGPKAVVLFVPKLETRPSEPVNLWGLIQGLAVVAGLAVSLREISRW